MVRFLFHNTFLLMSENPSQKTRATSKEEKVSNSRESDDTKEEKPFISQQSAIFQIQENSRNEDHDESMELIKYEEVNNSELSLLKTKQIHHHQQNSSQMLMTRRQNFSVLPAQVNIQQSEKSISEIKNFAQGQLIAILRSVDIEEQQDIKECLNYFNENELKLLQNQPDQQYRPKFKEMLDDLLLRVQKMKEKASEVKQFNVEKELVKILKECGVVKEELIQKAFSYLEEDKIKLLESVPDRKYRKNFKELLKTFFDKMNDQKNRHKPLNVKQELINILSQAKITDKQEIAECFEFFEENELQLLKQYPDEQFRVQFASSLQGLLKKVENELINIMKISKIDVQDKGIRTKCLCLFKEKKLSQLQNYSPQDCRDSFGKKLEALLIRIPQQIAKKKMPEQKSSSIKMNGREKQIKIRYQDAIRKIKLSTHSRFPVIKQMILKFLQRQKVIRQLQIKPILQRMGMKILIQNRYYQEVSLKAQTIEQLEDLYGNVQRIEVQIPYRFTIYYDSQNIDFDISCDCKVIDLKKKISQKFIPIDAQQLILLKNDGNTYDEFRIEVKMNKEKLSAVTSNIFSEIILRNKSNTQFYGFQRNYYQNFQKYSEIFLSDPIELSNLISSINFNEDSPEMERLFIDQFFLSVHEAIKRQFSINLIIQKYKKLVKKIKKIKIWVPLTSQEKTKVNESFVLTYLLHNSDIKLRIHLISLVKQSVPIPLYLRSFDNIYQVTKQFELTNQILWTLKKGYVVASFGLHTKENVSNEKGKSCILNEIFYTNFEQSQHKQSILKGVPFIALSIFKTFFPLHIIDIPHDSPQSMISDISSVCDMLIIQSWRNEEQTNQYIKKIKQRNDKIHIYCLYRDQQESNNISINYNVPTVKYNKIIDLTQCEKINDQIEHVKSQLLEFIADKASSRIYKMSLVTIFKGKQIYLRLMEILDRIKQKLLQLTPICQDIEIMKNPSTPKTKIDELQKNISDKLSQEIKQLIKFLLSQEIRPNLSIMLNYFRQNIKYLSQQLNIKLEKIYFIKEQFQKIRNKCNSPYKDNYLKQRNQQLQQLDQLTDNTLNFEVDNIQKNIYSMIYNYQNKIRPRIFSMELFWRQLIHLTIQQQDYKLQGTLLFDSVKKIKMEEIQNNLPFQVVDGDMLEVPSSMLIALFKNNNSRAIVFTVLGPQSSGKSTLLNFLFGCDFSTSEGRCTRGIYGTYFKFGNKKGKFSKLTNCDGIFVLDTEGLFAITNIKDKQNSDRENFDTKLIMFCLAVSDFVILNVCKNLDSKTNSFLQICNQGLEDLKLKDSEKRPEMIIVLNQNETNRTQQSEIAFQQIRNSFEFKIGVSLPVAYDSRVIKAGEVSLLKDNQMLVKKKPKQTFLEETEKLLEQILDKVIQKKDISKLSTIFTNFQEIWFTIVKLHAPSDTKSKQYKKLQSQIRVWIDKLDQVLYKLSQQLEQKVVGQEINYQTFIASIHDEKSYALSKFRKQFPNISQQQEDIQQLKKTKYDIIGAKFESTKANISTKIYQINHEKQMLLSSIESTQKMNEIVNKCKNNKQLTQKDQIQMFDSYSVDKIKKEYEKNRQFLDIVAQFQIIRQMYEPLMISRHDSPKCLLRQEVDKELFNLDMPKTIAGLKERYIQSNLKGYHEALTFTSKPPTNILGRGLTDASEKYFSMRKYFSEQTVQYYYQLGLVQLSKLLNFELLKQQYKKARQVQNTTTEIYSEIECIIKSIWEDINQQIIKYHLSLMSFPQFKHLIEKKLNNSLFEKGLWGNKKLDCKIIEKGYNHQCTKCHNMGQYMKDKLESDHKKCICLISTKYENTKDFNKKISNGLYEYIEWPKIIMHIKQTQQYRQYDKKINQSMEQLLNNELKALNLRIQFGKILKHLTSNISLRLMQNFILESLFNQNKFQLVSQKPLEFASYEDFERVLTKSKFLNKDYFLNNLKCLQILPNQQVPIANYIFKTKVVKYIPINNKDNHFSHYNTHRIDYSMFSLQSPAFQQYIFNQLKQKHKIFDYFIDNLHAYILSILQKDRFPSRRSIMQIINKVTEQISIMNNDLRQISCRLSIQYISFIHIIVVFIIVKFQWDRKNQKVRKLNIQIEQNISNQRRLFFELISCNDEKIANAQVELFIKAFEQSLKFIIKKKKIAFLGGMSDEFLSKNDCVSILLEVDHSILTQKLSKKDAIAFIENPYQKLNNLLLQKSAQNWKLCQQKYSFKKQQCLNTYSQFDKAINEIKNQLEQKDIKNCTFSQLFQLASPVTKTSTESRTILFEKQSKRAIFEYFIDTIIGFRKQGLIRTGKFSLKKSITQLKISGITDQFLKQILIELRSNNSLTITNLSLFINSFLNHQMKKNILSSIQNVILNSDDKKIYLQKIKILICDQRCPCCGRICSNKDIHQYHQCYDHQMLGLSGKTIGSSDKKANLLRCNEMSKHTIVQFNGQKMSWVRFSQYWLEKQYGGWIFDDINNNKSQTKIKYNKLWSLIGEQYCQEKRIKYVPLSDKIKQQIQIGNKPTHYIYAYDLSNALIPGFFEGLFYSLTEDPQKRASKYYMSSLIISMLKNTVIESMKVSIIKFAKLAEVLIQNVPPKQINLNYMFNVSNEKANYDNLFKAISAIAEKYINDSTIVVLLISCGQGDYPEAGIKKLKEIIKGKEDSFQYIGLATKRLTETMKKIAEELDGSSSLVSNENKLSDLFRIEEIKME